MGDPGGGGRGGRAGPRLCEGPSLLRDPRKMLEKECLAAGQGLCSGTWGGSLRRNVGGTMSWSLRGGETRSFLQSPIYYPPGARLHAVCSSRSCQLKRIEKSLLWAPKSHHRRGRVPHLKTRERSVWKREGQVTAGGHSSER